MEKLRCIRMSFLVILLLIHLQYLLNSLCDSSRINPVQIGWNISNENDALIKSFVFLVCRSYEDHSHSRQIL